MKIEIKKVEKVIEKNNESFQRLINTEKTPAEKYDGLHKLFYCFKGDLYKLFGDEYMGK